MVSEGLSHAVLPGLVIAFILLRDYNSPWLIIAAAASGLLMVWLTQLLQNTRLLDTDAGLGIVFAGMFSVGILLVSSNLRNTHFHADCIIDGNLALAPLDRWTWAGIDLGPRSWISMLAMLIIVIGFITLCFKELKVMFFDPLLADQFGLRPRTLQFVWLALVSLTTVAAFDVAGSILIVALMIAPPAAAYLLTDRLSRLLVISAAIAVVSAIGGFYLAMALDVSPTGPIASFAGMVFLVIFASAPRRGWVAVSLRRYYQRQETADCLVLDLLSRRGIQTETWEDFLDSICMPSPQVDRTMQRLQRSDFIQPAAQGYELTTRGRIKLQAKLEQLSV